MIYNDKGNKVVGYSYDAWGNILQMTDVSEHDIGELNPIRYRGYYYDEETGFYYLKNRYYNPEVGRFISADQVDNAGINGKVSSYNLYSYCLNNPSNGIDVNGEFAIPAIAAAAIGGGAAGAVISAISYLADNGYDSGMWGAVGVGLVTGAIGGATGMLGGKEIKAIRCLVVGAIAGVYSGIMSVGTAEEKFYIGLSTTVTVATATAASAFIFDTNGFTTVATIFANYATTISTSTPAEVANKFISYGVKKVVNTNNNVSNASRTKMTESEIRRTYGGMYLLE